MQGEGGGSTRSLGKFCIPVPSTCNTRHEHVKAEKAAALGFFPARLGLAAVPRVGIFRNAPLGQRSILRCDTLGDSKHRCSAGPLLGEMLASQP